MLSIHSASPKDLGIFNFVLTYFCKLSQSLCEKNRGTEHINKTMEWSTINKTAEERIYPGQLSVQCVLCILIRLKALRETYHFNDKTLLDLSHFFFLFCPQRKYPKDKTFWYGTNSYFSLAHHLWTCQRQRKKDMLRVIGACGACDAPGIHGSRIYLLLGHRALQRAGCFQSHAGFVCRINPMSLLHSSHNIWSVSPSPTLG